MIRQFKGKVGLTDEQAQKYGTEIDKLSRKYGQVTPKEIVEAAKDRKNPLHDFFDWNNDIAGEKWRLEQAGYLLRHIEIVLEGPNEPITTRFLVSISNEEEERVYMPVERVLGDKVLREQLLARAFSDYEIWKKRYQDLEELADIFSAVDKARKHLISA